MSANRDKTNSDIMHDIEGRHFGRCLDQVWGAGRRTLIELMDYPKAKCQVVVVKQFDKPVPRNSSSWPDLIATYVYVPLKDEDNTWTGLDLALDEFEFERSKP